MVTQAGIVWDESFTGYNFGHDHPMNPIRLDLTARLCDAFGLFSHDDVVVTEPDMATDEEIATVHEIDYIEAVRQASATPEDADPSYGLGTEDDPAFKGIHESAARIVAGTLEVCRAVWTGEVEHGVNFCGGMHHAMPDTASGFCIYNDIAVGIQWLLDNGAQRVVYVDIDVHHGDGVERIFWDDPRVLTISIHETGRALFPGTGWPTDIGGVEAVGGVANIALPPGVGDSGWLRAFHAAVLPLIRAFKPVVIVSQHGADSHELDPLAHLSLSVDAQRSAAASLHRVSHEVCGGKWVALGGGGYEVINVVPRTWTHLTAIASHRPIPVATETPIAWQNYVNELTGQQVAPTRMGDLSAEDGPLWWRSWESGYDPGNEVDRSIIATRQAVFPHMGLDILFD